MRILAIETSCDETSIALVECTGGLKAPQFNIIKNIVSSQIPIHRPFGGVVPNLAKREHLKNLPLIYESLVASGKWLNPNLIAVTTGPGLEPALWTGIEFAKQLSKELKIPLRGANHLKGHLYSFLGTTDKNRYPSGYALVASGSFPAIALLVSGGHTILLKLDSLTKWKKLGETRDDAAGEAFDKVARMMDLPYPGGPEIAKLALKGNAKAIQFPRPMMHPSTSSGQVNYDFSFSGLKTAVLYYLRDNPKTKKEDIAASFQEAVVDVLTKKTMRAAEEFNAKSIILCGGVAANKLLRKTLALHASRYKIHLLVPPNDLNGDNAAMIAMSAYIDHLKKVKPLKMEARGNLNL